MDKAITKYLATIGQRGGQATTPAKQKSSRKNGKLGGRPRKDKNG
jgi:hypothetical protein